MRIARQMTLATMAERNARLYPDRVALVCGNTRVTYSALNRQANRLARVLRRQGVSKGKRVAILSRNCHRYLEILFAVSKLGAVLVTLNWRLKPGEVAYIVQDSDSIMLVYGEGLDEGVQTLRGQVSSDVKFVAMASLYREADQKGLKDTDLSLKVYDDDVAVQMYTAAVEGRPRGAQLTHGGYAASSMFLTIQWSLTSADANFVAAPLFHVFGLDQTMAILSNGGKTVVVGDYEAAAAAEMIEREKVSVFASAGQQLPE
ncbi:MAG: AMP-binding protein, partial [Chloroflexi bacterium]|nr:AMP-binding protein [Chloroflexota bacterium]